MSVFGGALTPTLDLTQLNLAGASSLWESRAHMRRAGTLERKSIMSRKRNRGNGEGSIFKRQDGGPWYITWYGADGKRKTHCAKTTDKATAQRILADKLADV